MEYWNFLDGESYAFRQATDLNTTEIVGVRVYLKPHMNPAQLNHELQIRQGLHHRNIIKVIGAFEDEICYYIIVEKAGGMSFSCWWNCLPVLKISTGLLSEIIGNGDGERYGKFFFLQVVDALNYLHNKGICYRGLQTGIYFVKKYINNNNNMIA